MKAKITYKQIGIVHSPFAEPKGTPTQSFAAKGIEGMVEVFPEYQKGLKDIERFSHIILIYHFHLSKPYSLEVIPFVDNKPNGLLSTRAPSRPNPIGLLVVGLKKVEGNKLYVKDIDIVNGTPLLDIKPFVGEFDQVEIIKKGWLEKNIGKLSQSCDDERFIK